MSRRIVHLVEPGLVSWPVLRTIARGVRSRAGVVDHCIVVFGGSDADRRARMYDLSPDARIVSPIGHADRSWTVLRRLLRSMDEPATLHAWSARAALAGARARASESVLATISREPGAGGLSPRTLRRLIASGRVRWSFTSEHIRGTWRALGADGPIVSVCSDAGGSPGVLRARARSSWGVEHATPVIALAGEPAELADARCAAFQTGVAALAGHDVRIIIDRGALALERARRFTQFQIIERAIVVDDGPGPTRICGADILLWLRGLPARGGCCAESLRLGVALGMPVIAEDHPHAREVLAGAADAEIVGPGSISGIARVLVRAIRRIDPDGPHEGAPGSSHLPTGEPIESLYAIGAGPS